MRPLKSVPEPWNAFFSELNSTLTEPVCLICLGGFVITMCYGLERPTAEVDFVSIRPSNQRSALLALGGERSPLHRKHGVYVQSVTVANLPESYEDRLTEMFPRVYRNLRLLALDPYDLALSKIDRNLERDRADVKHLINTVPLDRQVLQGRYEQQFRPCFVGDLERADLTMKLWLDAFYG